MKQQMIPLRGSEYSRCKHSSPKVYNRPAKNQPPFRHRKGAGELYSLWEAGVHCPAPMTGETLPWCWGFVSPDAEVEPSFKHWVGVMAPTVYCFTGWGCKPHHNQPVSDWTDCWPWEGQNFWLYGQLSKHSKAVNRTLNYPELSV